MLGGGDRRFLWLNLSVKEIRVKLYWRFKSRNSLHGLEEHITTPNIYRDIAYHLEVYTLQASLHLSLEVHCSIVAYSTNFIRMYEFSHGYYKTAGACVQERVYT